MNATTGFPSDLEIAQAAAPRPITEIAESIGIRPEELILYGDTKAKVHLDILKRIGGRPAGKYVDVTAVTPTPLGEGKTTTTVGLVQGLGALGHKAIAAIRQPSLGPTFGIKGGAAGGGYSQVIPMDEFNLHLTGDMHAVGAAHNLAAAAIDARWYHERRMSDDQLEAVGIERLNIDVFRTQWRRVVDVNDRALRNVIVGLGGRLDGRPWETGYDITVASELMAILALVDGHDYASALRNLRNRCGRVVFGSDKSGRPITLEEIGVAGAVTVLMRDTLHPTIMQTLEGPGRLRPRRTLRQHRPRQLLDPRRPGGPASRRLRDNRIRVRRRYGHGEVLEHKVPRLRDGPRCGGPGGDRPGAQDPWRRPQGGAREAPP